MQQNHKYHLFYSTRFSYLSKSGTYTTHNAIRLLRVLSEIQVWQGRGLVSATTHPQIFFPFSDL